MSANGAPLSKTESYSASKSAMAAIFGKDHKYSQAKQADPATESGEEPPSGVKGKGTINEPYDQGNAPAQATNGEEPLSGVTGKGTADEPYDQGNKAEAAAAAAASNDANTTAPSQPTATPASATNGSSTAAAAAPTSSVPESQSKPVAQKQEERGRSLAPPATVDRNERSVSPGTLDDGSHRVCSGEQGKGYTPGGGLSKLKNKIFN